MDEYTLLDWFLLVVAMLTLAALTIGTILS